jgi:hypothetical protein
MIRFVHLHRSLNALNKPEKDGQTQDQNRDPECIPLDLVPPIIPKVFDGSWAWFIEPLFQNDEPIAPKLEILQAAGLGPHPVAIQQRHVYVYRPFGRRLFRFQPFLSALVVAGK